MGLGAYLENFFNIKLIDTDARISVKKAFVVLLLTAVMLVVAGYWFGDSLFSPAKPGYYDYRIAELKEILLKHPDDRAAVMELATNLYLKGDAKEGIALARKVLEQFPGDREVMLNLGMMLSDRGEYREAITLLDKLVKAHPGFETGKANFFLGKSYFETKDYRPALNHLEQAVKRDPAYPVIHYYIGKAYERLGDRNKALEAYRQAVRRGINYSEAEAAVRRLTK